MKEKTSANYKLAAKLTFFSAFISFVSFYLNEDITKTNDFFLFLLFTIALTIISGALMLNNVKWIKFVLLVLMGIGFIGIFLEPAEIFNLDKPLLLITDIFSIALQIYILVLLFKKPTSKSPNEIQKSI